MRKLLVNACRKKEFTPEGYRTSTDAEFYLCGLCVCACLWDCRGKEWDDVDKAEKERIELKKKEDGEFWYV